MTVASLAATLFVAGVDLSAYIIDINRQVELCHPGQMAVITLRPDAPFDTILPWQDVVITEQGVLVLTGYVDGVTAMRAPPKISLKVRDTFKRADSWFLHDPDLASTGQTALYWIDYFCDLVGINYTTPTLLGFGTRQVSEELPMTMMNVAEVLLTLAAFTQWQMRINPDGVLEFLNLLLPDTIDYDFTPTLISGEHEVTDENTRNVAKIWGYDPSSNSSLVYVQRQAVPGITSDRIMVFAHPAIDEISEAAELARAALRQFASIEEKPTADVIGNPNVLVGQTGIVDLDAPNSAKPQFITNLSSDMNSSGYGMTVAMGRKCLRLPGFGGDLTVIVVGNFGVWLTTSFFRTTPHWESRNLGVAVGDTIRVCAFDPTFIGRVYAVSQTNVYRNDNIFSPSSPWNILLTVSPFSTFATIACDPVTSGRMMVARNTSAGGMQVHNSVDAGNTLNLGFGATFRLEQAGQISYGADGSAMMTLMVQNTPFSVQYFAKLMRSIDNGDTFELRMTFDDGYIVPFPVPSMTRGRFGDGLMAWFHDSDTPVVGGYGLAASQDGGVTWLEDLTAAEQLICGAYILQGAAISDDGLTTLYLAGTGSTGTVRRSLNQGFNFVAGGTTMTGMTPSALYAFPQDPNRWIGAGAKVGYTQDWAATWLDKTGDLISLAGSPLGLRQIQAFPI